MPAAEIPVLALLGVEEDSDEVTARILDAALEEFRTYGLRRVNVDDIARRAGLHRATLYRRFETKDQLVQTALARHARRFFTAIAQAVDGLATVEDRVVEGFAVGLRTARQDPLLARMLTSEPETALPFATLKAGPLLVAARIFLADQLRAAQAEGQASGIDADAAAEIAVRLSLSLVLTPDSYFRLDSDDDARDFARRHLLPAAGGRPA